MYYDFLSDHFGRTVNKTILLYETLLALPFDCYLTTNFDPLLAVQARTAQKPCQLPPHAYPTLDRRDMGKRSVHYLHGMIEENGRPTKGSIVFAQDEFDDAYSANSPLMNFLAPTVINAPIVFVGCQLKEPTMEKVFDICNEQQEKRERIVASRGGFASNPPQKYILLGVSSDKDSVDASEDRSKKHAYYEGLGVRPVWYEAPGDDHSVLRYALENLADLPNISPDHGWGGKDDS